METALKESTYKPAIPLLGATLIAALSFFTRVNYANLYRRICKFFILGYRDLLLLSWVLCLTQTPVYCKLYFLKVENIKRVKEKKDSMKRQRGF